MLLRCGGGRDGPHTRVRPSAHELYGVRCMVFVVRCMVLVAWCKPDAALCVHVLQLLISGDTVVEIDLKAPRHSSCPPPAARLHTVYG